MLLWDAMLLIMFAKTWFDSFSNVLQLRKVSTTNGCLVLQRFTFQTVEDDKIIGLQNEYMIPAPPLHGLKVLVE